MSDPLSIAAIAVAVGGIIVNFIKTAHIQKCKSLCCWSDCSQPSSEPAPIKYKQKKNLVVIECPPTPPSPDTPEEEEAPATIGIQPKLSNC